jgi:RNA polymerase sigma-70 factor (ECF subfamily)
MDETERDRRDIEASLAGDDDAYRCLVERYKKLITDQMWRFSRDPAQCEELVQDVFVEAFLSLRGYRGDAPFLHWLRKIASRVGYRFLKRQTRQPLHIPLEDYNGATAVGDSLSPSRAGEILEALLSRLRPKERLILTLQYFEGCSTKEIAERMGWSAGMVAMRAYRARKRLREITRKERLLERLGWTS